MLRRSAHKEHVREPGEKDAILFGDGDELPSNHSNNPHMNDLIAGLGRRQVLAGGAALGALAFLGVALPASAAPAEAQVPAAEGLRGLPSNAATACPSKPSPAAVPIPSGCPPATRRRPSYPGAPRSAAVIRASSTTPATAPRTRPNRSACTTTACTSSRSTRSSASAADTSATMACWCSTMNTSTRRCCTQWPDRGRWQAHRRR